MQKSDAVKSRTQDVPTWYAVYTHPHHEKAVDRQLNLRALETYLPLTKSVRCWKNGRSVVSSPLFPGYVFVRIALRERMRVLALRGVVRFVGFNDDPVPIPDAEIDALRTCLLHGRSVCSHLHATVGERVRIQRGPLQGLEGVLVKQKGQGRFVVSLALISRSVSAEVDYEDLAPANPTA